MTVQRNGLSDVLAGVGGQGWAREGKCEGWL